MNAIEDIRNNLVQNKLDGFFVFSEANVTYLSGFSGEASILLVLMDEVYLATDPRYFEQAEKEVYEGVKCVTWIADKRFAIDTYAYLIKGKDIKKLGFENLTLLYKDFKVLSQLENIELIPFSGVVEKMRSIKTPEEIALLEQACVISDIALEKTLPFIKAGMSELDICARLEYELKTNGAQDISFDTLVISGSRTSLLHGKPSNKKVEKGDAILFDFGALYKGYHADISRIFFLGSANEQQKELYDIIKKAQQAGLESLNPGITGAVPNDVAMACVPSKYLPFYYPRIGHGVGMQIHELPFIGEGSNTIIEENMVLTIEPGVYIPDTLGMRIEDTVLITGDGFKTLNNFHKELTIL